MVGRDCGLLATRAHHVEQCLRPVHLVQFLVRLANLDVTDLLGLLLGRHLLLGKIVQEGLLKLGHCRGSCRRPWEVLLVAKWS